jgi:hypothetical protein
MQQSDFGFFWPRIVKRLLKMERAPDEVLIANMECTLRWLRESGFENLEAFGDPSHWLTEVIVK